MGPKPAERSSTAPGTPRFASRFLTIVFVLGAGGCATTGSIHGTFALPASIADRDTAMIGGRVPKIPPSSIRNAVAFVLDEPGSKPRAAGPSKHECVRQTPAGFEPSVIVIPVGTIVEFENRDSIYHSAFSVAKANTFDTDLYAPGQKRPVLFGRPGVVNVYCELHPQSVAVVVVLPNRLYARPNALGEFHLPPLAEGTYTVQAWHPIYGETSVRVKVPRKGNPIVHLAF
jgi:plastocyanin